LKSLYKQIGDKIREARQELGLTQEQLAERANLHPSFVGQIERGTKKASVQTLHRIASALNVSLASLFQFQEERLPDDLLLQEIVGLVESRNIEDKRFIVELLRMVLERIK
jgi:transcriptional regulator with XRE-family HTH domain